MTNPQSWTVQTLMNRLERLGKNRELVLYVDGRMYGVTGAENEGNLADGRVVLELVDVGLGQPQPRPEAGA